MQNSEKAALILGLLKMKREAEASIKGLQTLRAEKAKTIEEDCQINHKKIALIKRLLNLLKIKHTTQVFNHDGARTTLEQIKYINWCFELQTTLKKAYESNWFGECFINKAVEITDPSQRIISEFYPYHCGKYDDMDQKYYLEIIAKKAKCSIEVSNKIFAGIDSEIYLLNHEIERIDFQLKELNGTKNDAPSAEVRPLVFSKPVGNKLPPLKAQNKFSLKQ